MSASDSVQRPRPPSDGRIPGPRNRRRLHQALLYIVRSASVAAIAGAFLFAIALLSLYLWLPGVGAHKAALEAKLSSALGREVTVGSLRGRWDGLYPGVEMESIVLARVAQDGIELLAPLTLPEVRLSLAWLPLLWGELRVHHLRIRDADIALTRHADGRLQVRGFRVITAGERRERGVTAWLLRQTQVSVRGGRLTWNDTLTGEAPVTVTGIDASLHNPGGERHRLELRAQWPAALCATCSVNIDWFGDPRVHAEWNGQLQLNVERLQLAALPAVIRAALPAGVAGELDAKLRSEWQAGAPRAVRGEATLRNLVLSEPAPPAWRGRLPFAAAKIDWQGDAEDWNLYLNDTRIGDAAAPWIGGAIHAVRAGKGTQLQVATLDLAGIGAGLAAWPALPLPVWVRALAPQGEVRGLKVRLRGDPTAPSDYAVEADVRGLGVAPYGRFPGFSGVTGAIAFERDKGRLQLAGFSGALALPAVFAEPLPVAQAAGMVVWNRAEDHWRVRGRELRLRNPDGEGSASFEFRQPFDRSESPWLKLDAHATALDARHAERYYPHNVLSEPVRAWLTRFIVAGKSDNLNVAIEGPLRAFPFAEGGGTFRVTADVQGAVLDYLADWPRIHDATAQLRFEGAGIEVRGHGRIGALTVSELVTRIPNLRAPEGAEVAIDGRVTGAIGTTLAILRDAGDGRWRHLIPADLVAKGEGELALSLALPVRALADFGLKADYRFAGADLRLGAFAAHGAQGNLLFTRAGLRGGEVRGYALGGETQLRIEPPAENPDGVRLTAQGQVGAGGWPQLLPPALAALVHGRAPWWAQVDFAADGAITNVAATADLQATALHLPAPLLKPAATPMRLTLKTHSATPQAHVLDLQLNAGDETRGSARLAYARGAPKPTRAAGHGRVGTRLNAGSPAPASAAWGFARGRVHLGEGRAGLPSAEGLHLSVLWPAADGDAWREFLSSLADGLTNGSAAAGPLGRASKARAAAGNAANTVRGTFVSRGDPLKVLRRVSVEVGALDLFARPFGRVATDFRRTAAGWEGIVRGTHASGDILITNDVPRTWQLNFERLGIPPARSQAAPPADAPAAPPRDLPIVFMQSKSLQAGAAQLGRLALWGRPVESGWRIEHLVLSRPEMNLFAKGDWSISVPDPDAPAAQRTDLEIDFKSDDLGATLGALGIQDQIARARARVTGRVAWEGPPGAFALGTVQAALRLEAEHGEFLRVKQGASKLLGLFDVRSITRYINLDFSSAFGKGFAFDKIEGDMSIARGNAFVPQLTVKGPSADLSISGRAGLVSEDFDLEVGVTPLLRGSLALVGGIAGGPVGAGAALLLERLLKKQLAAGTRLIYTVQGPWATPVIRRVVQEPPPATEP